MQGDQATSMLARSRLCCALKGLQQGWALAGGFEALGNLCKAGDVARCLPLDLVVG